MSLGMEGVSNMETIMVCVTKQKTCQRLIDYGKGLMKSADDSIHIIHVANTDYNFLGDTEEHRALEYLYEKAREAGAELTVLKSDDVVGTLGQLVEQNDITKVVVGAANEIDVASGFIYRLRLRLAGKADLVVVPIDSEEKN